jgi:hypothetical protein
MSLACACAFETLLVLLATQRQILLSEPSLCYWLMNTTKTASGSVKYSYMIFSSFIYHLMTLYQLQNIFVIDRDCVGVAMNDISRGIREKECVTASGHLPQET